MQATSRDGDPAVTGLAAKPHPLAGPGRDLGAAGAGGRSFVTAVLVVHNGARWLARTLAALQASNPRPDRVIAVDTGSTDGSAHLLREHLIVDEVLTLPADTGFGGAVAAAAGSAAADRPGSAAQAAPPSPSAAAVAPEADWLWLLHDDSAPEPEALGALLAEAGRGGARVLGPKVRGWHDQSLLLECGVAITNSGRRYTGLQVGDRDQGQKDDLRDVLAVGSAGMLVRRDLWTALDGFDPALPMHGDDIEFCMRVRRSGQRVVVVPQAVLHHREAATHGVRSGNRIAQDPALQARAAALYTSLVHGRVWLLPLTSAVLLVRSILSGFVLLLTDGPQRGWAEIRVWGSLHLRPAVVREARRRLRSVAQAPRSDLRRLCPTRSEQLGGAIEHWAAVLGQVLRKPPGSVPWGVVRAFWLAVALAVVAAVATRAVWTAGGPLAGGALLPVVDGGTLWDGFVATWHDVGLGTAEPAAPYLLALIVAAAPPLVSTDLVVQTLLLFTVPLAAASAYLALRGLPKPSVRAGLAVAYGLTPASVAPALDGRLGTAAVAVLLPPLIRLLVRIYAPQELAGLPRARVRTLAAAALVLSVVVAFAPLVWVAVTALVMIAAMVRARRPVVWVWTAVLLISPLALLWPWSWAVLADPSRIMFEAGVSSPQLVAQRPPTWRLLLLDPGTLGPSVLPMALGLVAAALLGLALRPSRPTAVWGWLLVAVGLLGATVQTSQQFLPLGATTAQFGFAGPMLHLMAAGMVLAAAGLATGVATPSHMLARGIAAVAIVGLVAGPLLLAGLWINELTGPLRRSDVTVVPAFITEQAVSPAGIRTLLLEADDAGAVRYALVNGDGGHIGDADVAPAAETWRELSAAVGELAAGVGPAPVAALADNAVQYIVASTDDTQLTGSLDSNSALRRLSTTEGRGLWLVAGLATRARLAGPGGESPVGILTAEQRAGGGDYLDTVLEPGGEAQLRIAQFNDGRWQATLDAIGVPVRSGQEVHIDVPGDAPATAVVRRDQSARERQLLIPLAGLLAIMVLLLPRGHLEAPLDPDAGDDELQPPASGVGADAAPGAGSRTGQRT